MITAAKRIEENQSIDFDEIKTVHYLEVLEADPPAELLALLLAADDVANPLAKGSILGLFRGASSGLCPEVTSRLLWALDFLSHCWCK